VCVCAARGRSRVCMSAYELTRPRCGQPGVTTLHASLLSLYSLSLYSLQPGVATRHASLPLSIPCAYRKEREMLVRYRPILPISPQDLCNMCCKSCENLPLILPIPLLHNSKAAMTFVFSKRHGHTDLPRLLRLSV
jgi:hypothetical protein